jgi:hypothetical protein
VIEVSDNQFEAESSPKIRQDVQQCGGVLAARNSGKNNLARRNHAVVRYRLGYPLPQFGDDGRVPHHVLIVLPVLAS